jgi:branched-chain amino acid transport system substrate-binding protein
MARRTGNRDGDRALHSAAHPSPMNKAWVEAFKKVNNGLRPNFMAVSGYDGMYLIYGY